MNNGFMLFLKNDGDFRFGFYRTIALFPLSHFGKNKLWLPYEFIMDMSRILILAERRNYQSRYIDAVAEQFQMAIDLEDLSRVRLTEIWRPYHGQQVSKKYREDQCFPLEKGMNDVGGSLKEKRLSSIIDEPLGEWYFNEQSLLRFFSDARFQGFLEHSGFQSESDQIELNLTA